jgi:hypothetical protein
VSEDRYPVLASTRQFEGRVISLRTDEVRMSDGTVVTREIVEHPGAVGVVALDDREQVVLVNQYRHPVGRYLDELPAGLLDVAGEPAVVAAQRELKEETGLAAAEWHVLIDLFALGHIHSHVCLSNGLAPVMMQQTIGLKSVSGKICQANPWPYPPGATNAPGAEAPDTPQNNPRIPN